MGATRKPRFSSGDVEKAMDGFIQQTTSGYPLCLRSGSWGILWRYFGARADRISINIRHHKMTKEVERRFP
jgi:hypothetical protein